MYVQDRGGAPAAAARSRNGVGSAAAEAAAEARAAAAGGAGAAEAAAAAEDEQKKPVEDLEEDFSMDEEEDGESSEAESRPILATTGGGIAGKASSLQTFVVENFPKIVIGLFVFLSVLIFLLLRNRGENAALRCIESASRQIEEVPYPSVNFDSVSFKPSKGMYAAFKAEKWAVVLATGPPTEEIRQLAKLDGWQLLAVAGTQAPSSWDVPGVIFLSEEVQASLNFRIQAHLRGDSPARKNVGYLFAIQHGAKKIYDADERISVLGGTLEKVFSVELSGPQSRREPFFQYKMVQNRSIVNPYVHFGQRSMWPRGFPIKKVGEDALEVSYNEVTPGTHYIQQGLTNGFPDIDALFYYTRRSEREAVNVDFDSKAPPVALPQGTMAPMSSINTMFHNPAFWALMIPVSMTSRACDIVRGYWAQRLLWEIGGMLVVYPPSAFRFDQLDTIFPEDEKDLHKNTERLLKFLNSWKSSKRTLLQKILHLSHSMAESGYWSVKNVEFTAAWLQDLVSVGFHQPRMVALELGRVDPSLYNSEHVQFVPEALPSVYLGIHESAALEKEVGDWLKWRRFFGNIVLVLESSPDANGTVLAWRMFHSRLFKHVVVVSQQGDPALQVDSRDSKQSYEFMPEVFDRFPHADGYLYLKDDAVFNYWNFATCNKNKLWSLQKSKTSWQTIGYKRTGPSWYLSPTAKKNLKAAVRSLPPKLSSSYKRTMDDTRFVLSSSDAFYIPHRYVSDFRMLVPIAAKFQLRPEVAIPLCFLAMDRPANFDTEAFKLVAETSAKRDPALFYRKSRHLVHPWKTGNESELVRRLKAMSVGDPILVGVL